MTRAFKKRRNWEIILDSPSNVYKLEYRPQGMFVKSVSEYDLREHGILFNSCSTMFHNTEWCTNERGNEGKNNIQGGCVLTPLKCRAAPEATAPHTVLSFPPVSMCQWVREGARLKLSFSWEGRGTTGSSQYSPPHSGSHLGRTVESDAINYIQRQAGDLIIFVILTLILINSLTCSNTTIKTKTFTFLIN